MRILIIFQRNPKTRGSGKNDENIINTNIWMVKKKIKIKNTKNYIRNKYYTNVQIWRTFTSAINCSKYFILV